VRSAKIHSIAESGRFDDSELWAEYAEFSWLERSTEYMRKDEKWSFKVAVVCACVWIAVLVWPWVARIIP